MAQRMIFTWNLDLESFNKILGEPNLLDLRSEFEMRGNSLSRSLLIWERNGMANNWSLSDVGNERFYHIVNRHRQRALDTFPELVESLGNNPETRHAILSAATNAIFDANQSGYLSTKTRTTENANPMQQVFKAVMPDSSTKSD